MAVNKVPPTGWHKTSEMHCLRVLTARSSKSRCWPGCVPSESCRGECLLASSWFLRVVRSTWQPLACSCPPPVSDAVFTWPSPSVSVSLCPLIRTPVIPIGLEPTLLTSSEFVYSTKPLFPNKGKFYSYQEIQLQCICWVTIQPTMVFCLPEMLSLDVCSPHFSSLFHLRLVFFFFGHAVWHVGSWFLTWDALQWKCWVWTTGPPGKSTAFTQIPFSQWGVL